jgi:hypothetical protein
MLFTVVLELGSAKVSQGFGEILMKFGYLVCFVIIFTDFL